MRHARAVRPFILLAAIDCRIGVFPFHERAARAMGMLKSEAERALRRIDAVVDPALFERRQVSTTDPMLLAWYAEGAQDQRHATDRTRRPPLRLRGVRRSALRRRRFDPGMRLRRPADARAPRRLLLLRDRRLQGTRVPSNCGALHHVNYAVVPAAMEGDEPTVISYELDDITVFRSTSSSFFDMSLLHSTVLLVRLRNDRRSTRLHRWSRAPPSLTACYLTSTHCRSVRRGRRVVLQHGQDRLPTRPSPLCRLHSAARAVCSSQMLEHTVVW